MRERGVQYRRARDAEEDRPSRPPDSGLRFWQVLAVVGLIAATAGWTTAAVLALRPSPGPAVVAEASPSDEVLPSEDPSLAPPVESHSVADLEALLPADVNGTSLTRESWTGDTFLSDDSWSTSITSFLKTAGKTVADIQASQAYDATGTLDLSAGAFRVAGVGGIELRDAIIAAYKGDYPDLKLSRKTIGGLEVTNGDFGDGSVASYWYVRDNVVFDIETSDPAIAEAALASLPAPGTTGATPAPPSTAPGSAAPSEAASPSPG
ncbi:MAG: hypothetical protein HY262_10520 [Chloroflexi bacterium]|nr:hypothetical protein [Chloroflexota bacterium]